MINKINKENRNKIGIYQIRNICNNKIYIGSAKRGFIKRIYIHIYQLNNNIHHSKHLQQSYNKYGKDSFEFSIIEICDIENIVEKEQYWIDFYKSYERKFGYNILQKAYSSQGFKHSEESLKLISAISKSRGAHPNSVKAMQKANTGRKREKAHSERMSKIHSIPVIQMTLEGEFIKEWSNITEANLYFGYSKTNSNISKCCNGGCKSVTGFLWVKKEDYDTSKKYTYDNKRGTINRKTVYQYDIEGNFLQHWKSGNTAAKTLKINSQCIYNCLNGVSKTAGGFKWYLNKK